jgi:hypothetical protein
VVSIGVAPRSIRNPASAVLIVAYADARMSTIIVHKGPNAAVSTHDVEELSMIFLGAANHKGT